MKQWKMTVELDSSLSSMPLPARCINTAIALAAKEIAARYVSDQRFAKGKISIYNPRNELVYLIPQEGQGEAEFVQTKKEK